MSDRPAETGFAERRYRAQDGLSLYFRDYGEALAPHAAVLCLPGLTRNSRDFHDLALRLAPDRRVICPDYRGRGRSAYDPDWRHYVPRLYVNDLLHLLAVANLHRVVVIGSSLGGLLAMALAVAQPTAVAAVALNDVGPQVAAEGLGRILTYIGRDAPQPDWPDAVAFLRQTFPNRPPATPEKWLRMAHATFRRGADGLLHFDWDVALTRPFRQGGPVPDLWPLFRALRPFPVLALRGELSDVLSAATFERMAAELPGLVRVTVAGVGHVPALDEPEALEAIDALLLRTRRD